MFKTDAYELCDKQEQEVAEKVNTMFKRVYRIRKIRRIKRVKKWLGRHFN